MLYFLYGHSLELCQLGDPGDEIFENIGIATLSDYRLSFRVYPTLEPAKGSVVHGMLIHQSDEMETHLNECEFFPMLYTKRQVLVNCKSQIYARVFVQKFTKQLPICSPNPEYLANLYQLYIQYGLPLSQINNAIELTNKQFTI